MRSSSPQSACSCVSRSRSRSVVCSRSCSWDYPISRESSYVACSSGLCALPLRDISIPDGDS